MGVNLTRDALGGFKWTYSSVAASAVLQFGYVAVMARLLTPRDFGLLAIGLLFLRFGGYFAQMGIGQALVHKPDLTEADIRAGFTSSIALGLLFTALLVVMAPLAEPLFDTADVVPVVRVMAMSFVLEGIGLTAHSLLRRRLHFKTLAVTEVGSYLFGYVGVGVTAALLGFGVWSLVAATLAQSALKSTLVYAATLHAVAPRFRWRTLGPLYSFGGRVTAISLLEFLGTALDTVFIGRYAGQAPLGQYNRGQTLLNLPLERLTHGMTRVLFPAFSRIQADRSRIHRTYKSAFRLIAVVVLPAAAGMAVAADDIVAVVLGPGWDDAAEVLPLLAVATSASLLSILAAIICEATGVLNPKLALQAGHVALLALFLWLSTGGSLLAYAVAVAAAATARSVAYLVLMRRVLGVTFGQHVALLAPVTAVAVVAGTAVYGTSLAGRLAALPAPLVVVGEVAVGAATVVLSLFVGPLREIRRDARARLIAAGLLGLDAGRLGRWVDRLLRWRL